MFIHRARRSRGTASRHPFLFLLGFTVLFLAPALGAIGAAQSLPISAQPTASPTPTEAFDPPLQAQPTPTPTPRVTEEPDRLDAVDDVQANPTAVPATEPAADDLAPNPESATLTLNKGVCDDSGFDPYTATGLDVFQGACFSPDGEFEFTVANGAGFAETATTSLGSVQFTVPTGNVTMSETIPDGFGEPAVLCWSDLFPSPAADPFIGNGPSWNVAEGEQVECWWFNVSETEPQGHTIRVSKQVCPEGFVLPDDYWTLATGCADRLDGIGFALTSDGGTVDGITDASGEIEWTNVDLGASGQIQIDEAVPAGYSEPVVWCVSFPQEAADAQDFDFFEAAAVDGLVTVAPEQTAPHIFSCAYFNVTDGAPGDLTTDNLQEGQLGNTVTVVKHRCPMGVVEDADLDDYQVICTEEHDDIAFTLDHSGGSFPGTTAGGQVQWTDVPIGDFTIQETVPAGFLDPLAWCGLTPSIHLPALAPSAGGQVTGSFEGDAAEYICYVFNIADPDYVEQYPARVVVNKRICDLGVDVVLTGANTIDDIINACPVEGEGIEFTLDNADGSSTQAIAGDGDTYWDDVSVGPFTITEQIPDGYGEPTVYCRTNIIDIEGDLVLGIWSQVGAPGGVIAGSIVSETNETFNCWVFNIPVEDEENSVAILKWRCPEGSASDEDRDWYEANCVEEHDGVEFRVASDIGIAVMETAGGTVQFDGLPAGTVSIQETIPAGFAAPVVFCQVDGAWQQYDAPTGHWEYDFPNDGEPEALTCHVFNIPGEPGSVTLLKWTCPPGYDLYAIGADPEADCADATNGIDFQFGLSGIGEQAVLQTTGDLMPGGVVFDGLAPNTYKAIELVPAGIASVFVLECTGHLMGVLQPYPLQMGNVLEIDLDAGEHLTCHWYNVPETDGGALTVIKYTCATEAFVSDVDCEIEEDGKAFDLLHWNVGDGAWDAIDTAVTDGVGRIAWTELDAGDYGLDEHDGEWCHLTTNPVFGEGDFFSVFEGEETVVSVYNCDGEPGKPGDTPEKYPNTGVAPGARSSNQFQP